MKYPDKALPLALLFFSTIFLNGCAVAYKSTAKVLIGYVEDEGVDYFLTTDDPQSACRMSETLGPLLLSFGRVTKPPEHLATILDFLAGVCAEEQAKEAGLRYLRAIYKKDVTEARDAQILYKRHMALAAKRELKAYQAMTTVFGDLDSDQCPSFRDRHEELYFMVGLISGIQSLNNDIAANSAAGVPYNVAYRVLRGSRCLDNEQWWGVPKSVEAAIELILPSETPPQVDPYQQLADSAEVGSRMGVNLARFLQLQTYYSKGETDHAQDAIRTYVRERKTAPANSDARLMDEFAALEIQYISDSLWTQATGSRTPAGGLGTFWDDKPTSKSSLPIDIDGL